VSVFRGCVGVELAGASSDQLDDPRLRDAQPAGDVRLLPSGAKERERADRLPFASRWVALTDWAALASAVSTVAAIIQTPIAEALARTVPAVVCHGAIIAVPGVA
jgi:hypothetical protein